MKYDPIKHTINKYINKNRFLRKVFYICLDLFILRQWYVKRAISRCLVKCQSEHDPTIFFDAGAGFCQYSDYVLSKFKDKKVIAVDLKDDFLRNYANSLKPIKKERFSYIAKDLSVEEKSNLPKAHIIIAIDILEHIKDDISVLKNFHTTMSDNAFLIISTPSNYSNNSHFTEEHVREGYSLQELKNKLENTGFKIVSSQYTYGFWGNIYWHLTMKFSLSLAKLSKIFIPIYLIIIFFPNLILMSLDFLIKKKKGNGILIIAHKN